MSRELALEELDRIIDEEEWDCVDNLRVYKEGDSEGEFAYNERRRMGCCGFFDDEVEIDGEIWHIGCNYGH